MKKLLNFRPLFFIAIVLCLGILSAYFFIFNNIAGTTICALILFTGIVIFVVFDKERLKRNLIFSFICILVFSFGFFNFCIVSHNYDNAYIRSGKYGITAKVYSVDEGENYYQLLLNNVKINGGEKLNYNLLLNVYGESAFEIGDIIEFFAYLNSSEKVFEDKFYADKIANRIKYYSSCESEEITKIGKSLTVFEATNLTIKNTLKNGLNKDEFSVAYAMLCGHSENIDQELLEGFRNAGVAHIFAVSGLHIGFLCALLTFVFRKLKCNKLVAGIITVLCLLFYAGVCGFSASSIRATIMATVFLIANLSGKRYDGLSSLSIAAIIILIISPMQLFCIGFQLSFVVVLGILLLSRPISNIFKFLPDKLAKSIGVVVSAQIFGIPVCLYAFSGVSLIAIIINLIFVPVVGVVYTLLLISTLLGAVTSLPYIFLFPVNYLLKAVVFFINVFDYEIFIVGGFTFGVFSILYYLTFILPCGFFNLKKLVKIITSLLCAIICVLGTVVYNVDYNNATKIYVCYSVTLSATLVCEEEKTLIISDYGRKTIHFTAIKRAMRRAKTDVIDNVIILNNASNNDVVFLVSKLNFNLSVKNVYYIEKEEVDSVILTKTFQNINFYPCNKEDLVLKKGFNYRYVAEGFAVLLQKSDYSAVVFASLLSNGSHYGLLEEKLYDLIVCYDNQERIDNLYKPKDFISYTYDSLHKNSASSGNCAVVL